MKIRITDEQVQQAGRIYSQYLLWAFGEDYINDNAPGLMDTIKEYLKEDY